MNVIVKPHGRSKYVLEDMQAAVSYYVERKANYGIKWGDLKEIAGHYNVTQLQLCHALVRRGIKSGVRRHPAKKLTTKPD